MKLHSRGWAVAIGLAFSFTVAAVSTKADSLIQCDRVVERGAEQQVINLDSLRFPESDDKLNFVKPQDSLPVFTLHTIKSNDQVFVHGYQVAGPDVTQNPEPATMVLFGTGLAGLGAIMRKRYKESKSRQ
jgi:hypothetical protein